MCAPTFSLPGSRKKNTTPPTTINVADTTKPSLVPIRKPRQERTIGCFIHCWRSTSVRVPKPIPPSTINRAITQCTPKSHWTFVLARESVKSEKPALLKAEMLWNMLWKMVVPKVSNSLRHKNPSKSAPVASINRVSLKMQK